jgi:hypothetical protein
MRNQNIFLASALSLLVLTSSCKKETSPEVDIDATAVKFSSSINGQIKTKAVNNTWESGDAIGVFMKTGAGLTNVSASNKNYNTNGDGEFKPATADQTIYYPENGSTVDFIAYYPYKLTNAGNSYSVDVANQSSQSAIDLLYSNNATALSKTSTNANLVFAHQLSKLEFTVKKGSGVADLNGLGVAIEGLNTKASFDLATGVLSGNAQVLDISAKTTVNTASVLAEAIVLPVDDASGKVVTFTLPSGKFKLTLPAATKFEQGKKYTYEVELKHGGSNEPVAIALTAVITNWTNVPSGSYVVDQDNEVVIPPTGEEVVLYTESFGTGTIGSTKPKIGTYTSYDNVTFNFSDATGNADLRTISSYGEGTNAHVWLPAAKETSIKISGIKVSGYNKLKIKYDLASNISGAANTTDLNVIKVKVNGVDVTVSSRQITGADQNKFFTLELSDITPLAENTIEFYGQTATNIYGIRLDNVIITGVK